jgi:hypothetical protein
LIKIIDVATGTSILGAVLIALNIGLTAWGFVLFWLGSVFWIIWAKKNNNKHLVTMNLVYLLINTIGIWRNI